MLLHERFLLQRLMSRKKQVVVLNSCLEQVGEGKGMGLKECFLLSYQLSQ